MDYLGVMPTPKEALFQLSSGLDYIHSKGLCHGEIRPETVLISRDRPVQLQWSNYGLSGVYNQRKSFYTKGFRGTLCWSPPEILDISESSQLSTIKMCAKGDIFAAGCVYFFYLTRGTHPFGTEETAPLNISKGQQVNLESKFYYIVLLHDIFPLIYWKKLYQRIRK